MTKPRVLIADDHTLIAQAYQKLLEPEFEVLGIFVDGRTLLDKAPALKPDIIILDIAMPMLNGLEACRQLRPLMPGVKFIFLTMYQDPDLAIEAIRIGASAYVLKTSVAAELIKAIREVTRGRSYVTPAIGRKMEVSFIRDPEGMNHSKELTPRQREVLQLLAEGRPMKEAAYILNVSMRTIAFHKYRMMEKLGLKSNAELIQFAVEQRIVFPQLNPDVS